MTQVNLFERQIVLPDQELFVREKSLIGFENRYNMIKSQLDLLLNQSSLKDWSIKFHKNFLHICNFVVDQYPFVIFHGDIGTGKTVNAECIANRLVSDSRKEDAVLFKLSNRVRGSGLVGESSTNLAEVFQCVIKSAGKNRKAILLIDEGDSLGASRTQEHSHHEDKVSVNTLIQGIDDLRNYNGRIVLIMCTNRISVMDSALLRRAAIIEEFKRPTRAERFELFEKDLFDLGLSESEVVDLVNATDKKNGLPEWTYSDIRTRLYPLALAKVFPNEALKFEHILSVANEIASSPQVDELNGRKSP